MLIGIVDRHLLQTTLPEKVRIISSTIEGVLIWKSRVSQVSNTLLKKSVKNPQTILCLILKNISILVFRLPKISQMILNRSSAQSRMDVNSEGNNLQLPQVQEQTMEETSRSTGNF